MQTIFSGLPNDLIIQIVQIENRRKYGEERRKYGEERMKYGEVIKQLEELASLARLTDLCKLRDMFNVRVSMYLASLLWMRVRGC